MASYAYEGSTGGPCTTNPLTGEHEHHYGSPGMLGIEFARPAPLHTLEPSAMAAVQAMRDLGAARRLDAVMAQIVTTVGRARSIPYDADPVTANARKLQALAQQAGFTTQILATADACVVEGHRRLGESWCGFRATWSRGQTQGATWHEPWRHELIDDRRSVGVDAKARVGKVGHRSPGMGRSRMSLVGTPWGMKLGVTVLERRIRDMIE